jgi:hypothetical protein
MHDWQCISMGRCIADGQVVIEIHPWLSGAKLQVSHLGMSALAKNERLSGKALGLKLI